MRKVRRFLILLITFSVVGLSTFAASPPLIPGRSKGSDPDERWWEGIILPKQGVLPAREIHPSMYFDQSFLPVLRERAYGKTFDPDNYYLSRWSRISRDANNFVGMVVTTNDDQKAMAAKNLAFTYLITENTRYLEKAVANLKEAYSKMQNNDLCIATQMSNYAVAYDWVAPFLSKKDDVIIRTAIKKGANWLYSYLRHGTARNHNHRAKAAAALGSWSLAFSADRDAGRYLDLAMLNMHNVWKYMFTKDGIYRDGSGYYWVFTVINSTPFLWQYKNVAGVDLFPAMQPVFEWELKTSTPEGWLPNLSDGWYKMPWLVTVAAAYKKTPSSLGNATLGEHFQWRFFNADWLPVRYDGNWTGAGNQYYGWPEEFILYDSTITQQVPGISKASIDMNAGPRGGCTILRSNWNYNDPATRYLYFEGTPMSYNHGHADALQFIIHAENTIMAVDAGYGPQRFSGREQYCHGPQHNIITADGFELGDPEPTKLFINTEFFDLVEKEASYYNDKNARQSRSIAFPGQEYFVIMDTCTSTTPKTWNAYYHNRGTLSVQDNHLVWTTTEGEWGAAAKMHAFMLPASMKLTTDQGKFNPYGSSSSDVETTTYLTMTQEGTTAQYIQILVPRSLAASAPSFTDLSTEKSLGAKVEFDDKFDLFVNQKNLVPLKAGDLTVVATFAWVREEKGTLKYWAVKEGTEATYKGELLFKSDRPISIAINAENYQQFSGYVSSGDKTPVKLMIYKPHGQICHNLSFAGSKLPVSEDREKIILELQGSGELLIEWE